MSIINRSDVISYFQSQITNPINGTGKWATDNDPSADASSYSGSGRLLYQMGAGQVLTYGPAGEIPAGAVSVSTLSYVLKNAATVLSRARMVRLIKTSYPYSSYWYDSTTLAHMSSAYQTGMGTADLVGGNVSWSQVVAFINSLQGEVTAWRNNTLTFVEYYCHSSCHSNHSSRGRR